MITHLSCIAIVIPYVIPDVNFQYYFDDLY